MRKKKETNEIHIYPQGNNPTLTFSISSLPDPCYDDTATFVLENGKFKIPFSLATQESQNAFDVSSDNLINGCKTPSVLSGEVYVYKWQGARHVFLDFAERNPRDIPFTEEEKYGNVDWSISQTNISERYPDGYFECIPIGNQYSYMHPLSPIEVSTGQIHYESPRYVGFLDWGKAWVRFVTDCSASRWEIIDFSKIKHTTNGYTVSRDKGYEPGGVLYMTPNPASGNVFLSVFSAENRTASMEGNSGSFSLRSFSKETSSANPYYIVIYNSAGMQVRSFQGTGNTAQFSVNGLPAGVYLVHFTQNGQTHKEKLIVK